MSVVHAKGVEAPVPRRNRFLSSEKTGSRQSCDCNASIANNRYLQRYQYHGENIWLFKIDDTIEVRERCTRPSVRTAKRSAKFLLNLEKIARCIAGTVFPSTKIAVVKKRCFMTGSSSENREEPLDFELAPGFRLHR